MLIYVFPWLERDKKSRFLLETRKKSVDPFFLFLISEATILNLVLELLKDYKNMNSSANKNVSVKSVVIGFISEQHTD